MNVGYNSLSDVIQKIVRPQPKDQLIGATIVRPVDFKIIVKISISIANTHNKWEGICVKIYSKEIGEMVKQFFPFKQYLSSNNHLWADNNNRIAWFTYDPKESEYRKIEKAIDEYIKLWL